MALDSLQVAHCRVHTMSLGNAGSTFGSELQPAIIHVITSFLSIALYNVLELNYVLFLTFKRRRGLYFWSFFAATWGIALYSVGFVIKDFDLLTSIPFFYTTLIVVGWCAMVTGQSMVLYSRLHLIAYHRTLLRCILGMIVANAILFQIPTVILCYGANSTHFRRFATPYAIFERIQVTVFFIQELIISCLYLYKAYKFLRSEGGVGQLHQEDATRLMQHLIYMSLIVVALDTSILALQFSGRYASQTAVKGFIYSVKLKLEFDILNQMVMLARRPSTGSYSFGDGSQRSWNIQPEEQSGAHLPPQMHSSRDTFFRRVKHVLKTFASRGRA